LTGEALPRVVGQVLTILCILDRASL